MRLATRSLAHAWLEQWTHHRHSKHVPVRLWPRAPTTTCGSLRHRQQAVAVFSELCFDTRMAGTKRKSTRPGANRKPLSKSSLLPMSAQSAREVSLAHHIALAACRGDSANRHQINELVRSVYMAYFLQRMGFGDIVDRNEVATDSELKTSIRVSGAQRSFKIMDLRVAH